MSLRWDIFVYGGICHDCIMHTFNQSFMPEAILAAFWLASCKFPCLTVKLKSSFWAYECCMHTFLKHCTMRRYVIHQLARQEGKRLVMFLLIKFITSFFFEASTYNCFRVLHFCYFFHVYSAMCNCCNHFNHRTTILLQISLC